MTELRIDVWSDIACPWCYVGKRRLERALETHAGVSGARVIWHAFELDPSAPTERDGSVPYAERLARKYRVGTPEAQAMIDRMTAAAAEDGIEMRFDRIRPGNTFDAHRLLHWAFGRDKQDALKERLLRAYFTEGRSMGDPAALAALAAEVGLDADEAAGVLASDDHADAVRQDEARAAALGIHGVPFFVIDERIGFSGAQPVETIHRVIDKALEERRPEVVADGAMCGPDGC